MRKFFMDSDTEPIRHSASQRFVVRGENAQHMSRSLRMKPGDRVIFCDGKGTDYDCIISELHTSEVLLFITSAGPSTGEPDIKATLYQALPKGDKMEQIIQKAVELGCSRIVPFISSHCISRPASAASDKKNTRYNKIALEAAKQCGRGIVPQVEEIHTFQNVIHKAARHSSAILLYENGGQALPGILSRHVKDYGIIVGPEGGFSPEEVQSAADHAIQIVSLGKRILRTETAPLCMLSVLMFHTGNL